MDEEHPDPEIEPVPAASVRYRYDRTDLEAMVGFSFTDRELATYALAWGVHLAPGRSAAQGARKLVRTLEQEGQLHAFVTKLREDKPLVEWPEGVAEPVEEDAPATISDEVEDGPPTDESVGIPPPPPEDAAEAPAAPASAPTSLVDPYVEELLEDDASPGTLRDKQVWRRAILLAGVLVVGVGAGAVGMYFAFRGPPAAETTVEAPVEATSLGVAAADLVDESLKNLRQACEVDDAPDSARASLTASFRRCAIPEIVGRGRVDLPPPPPPDPAPSRPRMRLPGRTPAPPPSRAAGCMDRCHQVHNSCKQSECGREPTSAADYPNYQRCLAGCQAKYSKCRLSCR